jgi:glycosyltransferase involved in cell wall biosynthesis
MEPADFIEIVPQFEPDQLPQLLADSTVGAFPSYVEGFGMAVVEQLAAGLPTAAYDVPGPRDILRGDLGQWLVPPGDTDQFSDVICNVLLGDLAEYREKSARSVERAKQFSWPEIARETAAEYRTRLHHVRA